MSKRSWMALMTLVGILLLSAVWGLPYGKLDWVDKVFAQVYGDTTQEEPQFLPDGSLSFPYSVGAKTVAACPYYWRSSTNGAFFQLPLFVIPEGKSLRVTGIDPTGQYYQIVPLGAPLRLWMPVQCLGTNPELPWYDSPLPVNVIQ